MTLSRSDLVALARKYRTLAELRRAQQMLSRDDVRTPLQNLAREFPGALRELDLLPLDEIDRRFERLEAAALRGSVEPWMGWMHAYHLTMRAALGVKRRLAGQRVVAEATALEIAAEVSAESGVGLDAEFVQAVARPPQGRINVLVLRRLAIAFSADPDSIARALFPERSTLR